MNDVGVGVDFDAGIGGRRGWTSASQTRDASVQVLETWQEY